MTDLSTTETTTPETTSTPAEPTTSFKTDAEADRSLKDARDAIWENHKSDAPGGERTESAEKPTEGRARDERGKFVSSKPAESEAPAAPEAPESEQPEAPEPPAPRQDHLPLPRSWSPRPCRPVHDHALRGCCVPGR